MKTFRYVLVTVLLASLALADNGQKGRERHREMTDAVLEQRAKKIEAKTEAEATGKPIVPKCPDLVIKKDKRTTVIKCGNPKRNNPDCPSCGVKA
jgi:hypothetical protein